MLFVFKLDLKVTQREQPPTLKEVSLALCQSPCSSRRERREPLSLREAAAFIAQKFTSFNGHGKWGSQNEDGSWNGMVGMVNTGEVDLAMAGITITASRSTASDFTYRYHTEPSVVAVKVDTNKSLYFIRPLKGLLVLLYLLLPLFLSLLALAVEICLQRLATSRHRAFILQPWAAWFGNAVFSFARKIFTIGLSVRYLSRARFVLFLEFCFLVCVIVMSATYSGNLTAAMAVRRIEWPFRDLQGLAEADDYVLLLAEGTLREDLFKESKDGVYKQLWEKYSSHTIRSSENDDLMRILRKGSPKAAFTADRTDIVKRRVKGDCDILMLRETYFPAGFGFSIPKQATYLDAFNHVIQKLLQSGVIERWYEKNLPQLPSNMCTDEMVASSDTVRLEDIEFIICFVMCGGLCLATAALFLESNMRNLNASARWLTGSKQS
ncbi:hypothetical protein CAPTEDRAFT_191211 [Capitella teleta]|uniref:Ionotropic glutamate receptor C-terminal domain-containing protein n=1 Tax=Capitella teleta TaxID=283909 RepID=R7TF15_CAPTE|nr:hypothetical protein CAPTEDRAFT_191211 [Capitella teleta]|eukprot:ELT92333.1 hypothetical protein CAPTEDRAFT_191211 [Capitella teleta]